MSEEWKNSEWVDDPDYDYAEECLTSRTWWSDVKWVIEAVKPLYGVLRFADQQKKGTISGVRPMLMNAMHVLETHFEDNPGDLKRFTGVVKRRVQYLCKNTLICADSGVFEEFLDLTTSTEASQLFNKAYLLDPESNYKYGLSDNSAYMKELTLTVERIADSPEEAVEALAEFEMFRAHRGMFDGRTLPGGGLMEEM